MPELPEPPDLRRDPVRTPTLATFARAAADRFGEAVAIRSSRPCRWPELSYARLAELTDELARGLVALGVTPGERVAVLAETRPEWTVCSLAIAAAGAVCVPVYPTNSPEECEWVLADSGASVLICEDAAQAAKVGPLRAGLPRLRDVVSIEPDQGRPASLDDLLAWGRKVDPAELDRRAAAVPEDSAYTIVYTSGTTGNPKGCPLTHAGWNATADGLAGLIPVGVGEVVYLYLPLAHMLAQAVQLQVFALGGVLHYFGGDITKVVDELAEVRPDFLPSVPRMFEKVYARVTALLDAAPEEDRAAFGRALDLGRQVRDADERGEPVAGDVRAAFEEADERWLSMVRGVFGGRVREALTGAAPIAVEILEFFHACGVPLNEGYGMTESTAVISLNARGRRRFGTVGRPIPGVRVRIADDGEVLASGGNVFAGYHGDEAATAEVLEGGWLHTGDLGELDEDGYLRITGRKKDLIIPASGKNISPSNLENDLQRSRWIAGAVVHGDRRPYLVALLTLDAEEIRPWAVERGLPENVSDLADHPEVIALLQGAVDEVNVRYSRPEQIRRFAVLPRDFTPESGELTPSLKIRRAVVNANHAGLLDSLYGG
ncbi:long-chain fatty acid--CoA ligase [Actinomadura barringtoniae]|uniref:Acyl-CoA synthetase n=1 Tax=Actinomadura barringtoniae TaxID=1427535 RepID=A0A939T9N9_9ACTN|nr:AMP-dependent synthetase/ligase [Actinomadura barringtoniae]MBO2451597.1 long-chain fatty acid--CoA ligase [Actinomadura barringtoniae]